MSADFEWPMLLRRSLDSERIHSGYLLAGPGDAPRNSAIAFARGLACTARDQTRPCETCVECRRSLDTNPVKLDGTGRDGPPYRHIGDHPDLYWVDRGDSTRVRIGQVRALRQALGMGSFEGGWRVVIVADAEWLNKEAQNGLLHLLEEPPDRTCLILVATTATALLATIRSRCQRVRFPAEAPLALRGEAASPELQTLGEQFDNLARAPLSQVLDWAEEYRGNRSVAAENVETLLAAGSQWLRECVAAEVARLETAHPAPLLEAFDALAHCRRDLAQRNANPQMVAERALLAVRRAVKP